MNVHTRMRNQRMGLEHSTSPLAHAAHTGILESLILYAITAALPGLSNAAIGILTTGLVSLATTAITVGLNYLLMPKPPKPADGKAPKLQAIPPVIFAVGECRVGGAYMLWEEKNGALYGVTALVGHASDSIIRIYFGETYITAISGSYTDAAAGGVVTDTNIDDGRFVGETVRIGYRLGAATETAFGFITSALSTESVWTSSHRGDGQTSIGFVYRSPGAKEFTKRFPSGPPQPSAVGHWAKVWDPRDEAQNPANPATFTWSRNAALCLLWYLCFCPYGPKWDYERAILPVVDRWIEEANICDEAVPLAIGGTEPRYEANGWATTETDPIAIVNALLAACDGHLAQHGDGTLILTVGKFREELVETITDADIVGHTVQYDVPEEDEINRLVPKFTYPATDYSDTVADYFESTADQMRAGRILSQEADLQWVTRWRQARRLTFREWKRLQQKVAGSFDLRLSAVNAIHARWVRVLSPLRIPLLNNQIVENRRSILALQQGGFQMEWRKHPADIDAWTPASDEGAAPPVPLRPDSGLQAPEIDSLTSVAASGSVYLRVVILDPGRTDVTPVVRYRIADVGAGVPGEWIEQRFPDWTAASGLVVLNTPPVPNDRLLEVQAALIGTAGSYSDWSDTETVTAVTDTVAPGALTSVSVSAAVVLGGFQLNYTTSTSLNLYAVKVYRCPRGAVLNKVTHLVETVPVLPGVVGVATPVTRSYGDLTRTNQIVNGDFASATGWTPDAGWVVTAGKAVFTPNGTTNNIRRSFTFVAGSTYRLAMTVSPYTAGAVKWFFSGGASTPVGAPHGAAGTFYESLVATTGNSLIGLLPNTTAFNGSVDDLVVYQQTGTCLAAGDFDVYAEAVNRSGVGTLSGPYAVSII